MAVRCFLNYATCFSCKTIIVPEKNPPNWPNVIFKCKKLVSDFTSKLPVQINQKNTTTTTTTNSHSMLLL